LSEKAEFIGINEHFDISYNIVDSIFETVTYALNLARRKYCTAEIYNRIYKTGAIEALKGHKILAERVSEFGLQSNISLEKQLLDGTNDIFSKKKSRTDS
jgi:hypothetical protein